MNRQLDAKRPGLRVEFIWPGASQSVSIEVPLVNSTPRRAARFDGCCPRLRGVQALSTLDSRLKANDAVLFIDRKGRRYMKILRPGKKILIRGEINAEDMIGVEE